jgi:glycosyltransferase involved in cell wall biosynthesis
MTTKPLVSVIIIFLNEGKFIEEAIASVLGQSYTHWELLLVDDGSTDGSREIAQRYADGYRGKIHYLAHENRRNQGMSASRNLGIRHATGEYIGFLDADDVWLAHKLERQVVILGSNPGAAMVYGPSRYWFSWTKNGEESRRDYVRNLGVQPETLVEPPILLTLSLQSTAPTPCPSNILVRRRVVDIVGGFEEQFRGIYQLYEDQAFLAKVCVNNPVFVSGECWDKYRQHPESCVSVVNRQGHKYTAGLFYLAWLERYLSEHAIKDDDLWKALRGKRFRYRYMTFHRLLKSTQRRLVQAKALVGRAVRRNQQR